MTYLVAKEFIALHLLGDNTTIEPLATHFYMATIDLLTRCEPTTHTITYTGVETDIFRHIHPSYINDEYVSKYLRLPEAPDPIIDTDQIDIDESLVLAIVFFVCSYFSRAQGGKKSFEARAEKIISIYTSNQADLS